MRKKVLTSARIAGRLVLFVVGGALASLLSAIAVTYVMPNEVFWTMRELAAMAGLFAILFIGASYGQAWLRHTCAVFIGLCGGIWEGLFLFPFVFENFLDVSPSTEARVGVALFLSYAFGRMLTDTVRFNLQVQKQLKEFHDMGIDAQPISPGPSLFSKTEVHQSVTLPWADLRFGPGKVRYKVHRKNDWWDIEVTTSTFTGRQFKDAGGLLPKLKTIETIIWQRPSNDQEHGERTVQGMVPAEDGAQALEQLKVMLGMPIEDNDGLEGDGSGNASFCTTEHECC